MRGFPPAFWFLFTFTLLSVPSPPPSLTSPSLLPFPLSLYAFLHPTPFPPFSFFLFFFLLDFFFPSPLSSATRKISQEVKEKKNQMPRNSFSASVPFSFLFFLLPFSSIYAPCAVDLINRNKLPSQPQRLSILLAAEFLVFEERIDKPRISDKDLSLAFGSSDNSSFNVSTLPGAGDSLSRSWHHPRR